jgi:hypothetical protein
VIGASGEGALIPPPPSSPGRGRLGREHAQRLADEREGDGGPGPDLAVQVDPLARRPRLDEGRRVLKKTSPGRFRGTWNRSKAMVRRSCQRPRMPKVRRRACHPRAYSASPRGRPPHRIARCR